MGEGEWKGGGEIKCGARREGRIKAEVEESGREGADIVWRAERGGGERKGWGDGDWCCGREKDRGWGEE